MKTLSSLHPKSKFVVGSGFLAILLQFSILMPCSSMPRPTSEDKVYFVQNLIEQKQEKSQWCAAAAARMMMSTKTHKLPTQSTIISKEIGKPALNIAITTEGALNDFGYSAKRIAPDYNYVVASIKRGKPVTIYHLQATGTSGQAGHAVVAYGTFNRGGKDYLIIYDPYYGRVMTWDDSYVEGNLEWYAMIVFA